MTNTSLARSYLVKARHRLKVLAVLFEDGAHSDVVRSPRTNGRSTAARRCPGLRRRDRELMFPPLRPLGIVASPQVSPSVNHSPRVRFVEAGLPW
jgi:hypothetical protein